MSAYSVQFAAESSVTVSSLVTVGSGKTAVLRQLDVSCPVAAAAGWLVVVPASSPSTVVYLQILEPAVYTTIALEGRWVFEEGDRFGVVITAGEADVFMSGYLLNA